MVLIDMYLGPEDTPKLFVPDTFKPTRNDRGCVSTLKTFETQESFLDPLKCVKEVRHETISINYTYESGSK